MQIKFISALFCLLIYRVYITCYILFNAIIPTRNSGYTVKTLQNDFISLCALKISICNAYICIDITN